MNTNNDFETKVFIEFRAYRIWFGIIIGLLIAHIFFPPKAKTQTDTTAVILLVCDTTKHTSVDLVYWPSETQRLIHEQSVFWIRGYHVTKTIQRYGEERKGFEILIHNGELETTHIAWLGPDKKRINYLVWDSRRVK